MAQRERHCVLLGMRGRDIRPIRKTLGGGGARQHVCHLASPTIIWKMSARRSRLTSQCAEMKDGPLLMTWSSHPAHVPQGHRCGRIRAVNVVWAFGDAIAQRHGLQPTLRVHTLQRSSVAAQQLSVIVAARSYGGSLLAQVDREIHTAHEDKHCVVSESCALDTVCRYASTSSPAPPCISAGRACMSSASCHASNFTSKVVCAKIVSGAGMHADRPRYASMPWRTSTQMMTAVGGCAGGLVSGARNRLTNKSCLRRCSRSDFSFQK